MKTLVVTIVFAAVPVFCLLPRQPCVKGYFACGNSTTCIPREMNCDGKKDCEDGSDEKNCLDETKKDFWNQMFRKRPDEDREKKNETCGLTDLPPKCTCTGRNLYCTYLGLTGVPADLPSEIQQLDLTGNLLDTLSSDDFPALNHTTELIISRAKIRDLGKEVFRNMPSLEKLYLAGNLLATLQDDVFAANSVLNFLDLSHNPLKSLSANTFRGLRNLRVLDLKYCQLSSLPRGAFDPLVKLRMLYLEKNSFEELPRYSLTKLRQLIMISLSGNKLLSVNSDIFSKNSILTQLSLAGNKLTHLAETSFGNITLLNNLDLSDNNIETIEATAFRLLTNLKSLDLRKNSLKDVTSAVFEKLVNLEHIYFDDFQHCSYALHVRVCRPQSDGISSTEHLLDKFILRVFVWIMAAVSCIGNFLVMIGRVLFKEPNEVHSFYIKNLCLADLLMGVYLFIIASYDVAFRGIYVKHQLEWRNSWQCQFCGFISTVSSEASVLVLTVITIDRYVSIKYPLASQRRNWTAALLYMIGAWATAVILASLPLLKLNYFGTEFYGNNGMCLPLHIHRPYAKAWEYSTFMFCGINSAAFLLIVYAYVSMFFTISRSKSGLRSTQQQQDNAVVKRFAFIIGTDFVCWVPVIVVKLVAFSDVDIPVDLYAWIAVFLLPINSALNPVLYTLTTKLFKQHLSKLMHTLHPFNDLSNITLSSIFHSRSSKRSYFSENDHSFSSRSSQLQSRKASARNGIPLPQPV